MVRRLLCNCRHFGHHSGLMLKKMIHDVTFELPPDLDINPEGDLLLIDNAERIGQQIKITLQFWFQEWFLDTTQGIPYLEYICIKNPNLQHIRQIFREAIQSVPDVDSVTELTLSVNAKERILSVTYTANTSAGLLTSKELLGYG